MQKADRRFNSLAGAFIAVMLLFAVTSAAQTNPVPLINDPLVPGSAVPGGKSLTLTVNGTGFASGASVLWNGSALVTVVNSASKLTATVPAADIATAGTAYVSVTNPKASQSSNVLAFPITNSSTAVAFVGSNVAVLYDSTILGVADFNNDGDPDIAVVDNAGNIDVLLGHGDGTFSAPVVSPLSVQPAEGAVIRDFNGDGNLDLATSAVGVYFGKGDGTFTAGPQYPSTYTYSASGGDFNADGQLDLAIAGGYYNGFFYLLLGQGDGKFQSTPNYNGGISAAVGDFNRDGKLDIASSDGNNSLVDVFLGNGDGSFQNGVDYGNTYVSNVTTADFNGDGILDLAANGIVVLLGKGDGTFGSETSYATGLGPFHLLVADFNGDGKPDLITTNSYCSPTCTQSVSVLLGNGDGTFQNHVDLDAGSSDSYTIAAGDFNRDGRLDFVTLDYWVGQVSVFLQTTAQVSSTSLAFGDQSINTTSPPQTLTLTNIGSAAITVSGITITGSNSSDFAQTNTCGTSLAAGASCAINVTFTPNETGSLAATLNISDSAVGSPQTVSLTGTGTEPTVMLSPASLTFGVILVNGSSSAKPITLTNTGNGSLSITSISTTGDFSQTNTCGSSVAAGASCVINVTFKPTATGTLAGSLLITDNAPGSPQTVALSGTGTVVRLSAVSINFGSEPVGSTAGPVSLILANTGTSALEISSIGIQGADAGDFAETNTCGKSLPAGATCALKVTFTPTAKGTRTATLGVTDNGGGSPQKVALSGTGT
jgi:hypothetical protein